LGVPCLDREGDEIEVDVSQRRISLLVDDTELAQRRAAWIAPQPNYSSGVLAKYARLVQHADDGAITSLEMSGRLKGKKHNASCCI
jgi:dihydroxy-acid dehydratase